jgi:hypothetical protein
VKAIETWYDGRRYRSRREARWARFFDVAQIPVQYEEQGFDLGEAGPYLPDFVINPGTSSEAFFEVKGLPPTRDELAKAEALCEQSKRPVYVYYGEIVQPAPDWLDGMGENAWLDALDQQAISRWWNARPAASSIPATLDRLVTIRRTWLDDYGQPTAYRAFTRDGQPHSKELALWWTDCPYCRRVVLKLHGQVGMCPDTEQCANPPYPHFAHATARLQAAYTAARAERFGR